MEGKVVLARTPGVLIQRDVPAKMRDGTTLMSNVYRPADGDGYPVLLTRLPYGKDLPSDGSVLDPVRAAEAGYIVVVQDVRRRYRSEGRFVPFVAEYEDGYDTVEWAAKLPGSNGSVGMYGLSYFGKSQWHAAVMRPPSLKSRNLNTGESTLESFRTEVAHQTIFHDAERRSRVTLTVVER